MENKKHHLPSTFLMASGLFYFWFDIGLIVVSIFLIVADISHFLSNGLYLIIVSIVGLIPVLINAFVALYRKRLSIDLLAAIALIFSLLASEWRSAVFIGLMLASARLFVRYTTAQAERSVKSLFKLRPTKVHVFSEGKIIETDVENVKINDLIAVEAGQRVAVDGIVISGQASIDQSSLTGESEPILKTKGDEIFSSTLNINGSLVAKAKRVGKDTTFSKILELVEKSQAAKSPITTVTQRFTSWYILATLIGVIVLYSFSRDLSLVLSVLLVTCADDLAVAIPLSLTAAIGAAAKQGIIIKGGDYIEGMSNLKTAVFDKTGTITEGKPQIKKIIVFDIGIGQSDMLSFLGSLESESEHPTAKAIYQFVCDKKIKIPLVSEIHEEPGFGISGIVQNRQVSAGKLKFLKNNGVRFSEKELESLETEKEKHRTLTILSVDKKPVGFVSLSDAIRPSAKRVVSEMKNLGVERMVVLTGDNEKITGQVSSQVGIPEFYANLMPQDKIDFLKKILNPKYKVAMIGDGVNDAAALAIADIGVAMGAIGSDAAIESADIVLMRDDLKNIPQTIRLSRYAMKIIKQDLWIWAAVNAIGLVLVFLRILGPAEAAAYNFLTDFLPLFNSLRLFRLHLRPVGKKSLDY